MDFDIKKIKNLPKDIWKNEYYSEDFEELKEIIKSKKVALYIGSHKKFSKAKQEALSLFAKSNSIPIFCDHMAHYKGDNRIMLAQAFGMINLKNRPDIVIDIGGVSGEYYALGLFPNTEIWRISENGNFTYRFNYPVTKFFDCKEEYFFKCLTNYSSNNSGYYEIVKKEIDNIVEPELPFCNSFIIDKFSKCIPNGSSLHHAVSNTKRNMNFHQFDNSIDITCNIGVCGIDGPVSTMVGQSLVAKNKKVFGIVGDLAFFYDMNALGQRDISNNLRILLINNGRGEEFRLNSVLENNIEEKTDCLIAAKGHNRGGAKGWAESCGFEYMSAKSSETFMSLINSFCNDEFTKPVIFEVFTQNEDEQQGLKMMKTYNK
jgi:2-succinyl-5-enolpyruvyl-6-hydroxy-3-cyclohexene-1-carboxylate synthase